MNLEISQCGKVHVLGQNMQFIQLSSVQAHSRVQHFETLQTAARQASLSITNSRSLLKLISIESVMPSNHLILCPPLLLLPSIFPSIRVFSMSQFFTSGGQSIGVSASTSVLPVNTQNWSPLGWTGWISLQAQELSRVFSNTTVQKYQFFCAQLCSQSNSHIHTWPREKPQPWTKGKEDQCGRTSYPKGPGSYGWLPPPINRFIRVRLCNPVDCSSPGFSVRGISQARILEQAAISSSRESSWSRNWTHICCTGRRFFTTEPPGKPLPQWHGWKSKFWILSHLIFYSLWDLQNVIYCLWASSLLLHQGLIKKRR